MTTKILEVCATENGTYTNITNMIKPGEFTVDHIEVSPNRDRSPMTGTAFSDRIALKLQIKATCNPLKQADTQILLPLIKREYLYVNYLDPELGYRTHIRVLSNNVPATAMIIERHGNAEVPRWDNISFTFEEV